MEQTTMQFIIEGRLVKTGLPFLFHGHLDEALQRVNVLFQPLLGGAHEFIS